MTHENDKEYKIVQAIRVAICQDTKGLLLKQPQIKEICDNPYTGYCYIASEAFIYMISCKDYKSMFLSLPKNFESLYRTHWFIQSPNGDIIDPTADQFDKEPPYNLATAKGFLTKKPSKRCMALIKAAKDFID